MDEKTHVLIVEDETRIARFLQMELEHEGFTAEIEGNGTRAYERIIQENFDIILLDVMLPGMDGIEICRRVRTVSNVPIIMLTARDAVEDRVEGLDIGADDYITKPFAVPELIARVPFPSVSASKPSCSSSICRKRAMRVSSSTMRTRVFSSIIIHLVIP